MTGDVETKQTTTRRAPGVSGGGVGGGQHRRKVRRMASQVYLPRLIKRDYPYEQSSNRVRIGNANFKKSLGIFRLIAKDWFHVLLRWKWYVSFPFFLCVWVFSIFVFAWIYMHINNNPHNLNKDCGLGDKGFKIGMPTAYAFSLETCTTVGYGLPGNANGFFGEECESLQIAITFQMIWSMLSNAFLVSFFFALMSKSETRSIQLIFAKKICVNVVHGGGGEKDNYRVCVSVRCYDLDSSFPLVECHARMYLIDHRMKFHPLRLIEPNDDLGGMLYPSSPTTIVHHVDHHSALSPRTMPFTAPSCGLPLRSVDSVTASRDEIVCPVCGESYGTYERFANHVRYARIVEEQDDYPIENSHRGFVMPDEISPISLEEVQRNIERKLSEIVVVVEAIDPQLSGTFQAVQSYKYEDIEFGADFERCMFTKGNKFFVDLEKFHGIQYDDSMYTLSESKRRLHDRTPLLNSNTDDESSAIGIGGLDADDSRNKELPPKSNNKKNGNRNSSEGSDLPLVSSDLAAFREEESDSAIEDDGHGDDGHIP